MKRILVFGAQSIAVEAVKCLLDRNDVEICAVVASDMQRDIVFSDVLVADYCYRVNIPIYEGLNVSQVESLHPDLIFSLYHRKILSKDVLECAKDGAFNVHPGLLPKYRGCVPTYWAILNGESVSGVTLHRMTEGIDDGDIVAQREIVINELSGAELHAESMKIGFELFKDSLDCLISGNLNYISQDASLATYFGPYRSSYRYINWNRTAEYLQRHIRAHKRPYQGAIAWNKYCEVRINSVRIVPECGWAVGRYEINDGQLKIQASDHRIISNDYDTLDGQLKEQGLFVSGVKNG